MTLTNLTPLLPSPQVRLRDKLANRAGKIFRDPDLVRTIMASRLDDTKEIALQVRPTSSSATN